MPINRLDQIYRSVLHSKYFIKGWGKPENLKRIFKFRKVMSNRETCYKLVPQHYPVTIDKEEEHSDCRIIEGHFTSPFINHLPGLLPPEAEIAYFQAILPKKWRSNFYKPVCIHLAGTGDHYFWRRRTFLAKPLLKEAGIGAILLENPFYGTRKPKDQVRSILHNVSDIFVMGGCLIMESMVLLHWSEHLGFGPLGVTGLSMGGHMASLAATAWPKPIVLVPCLSWSTASGVFTEGVLSGAINWDLLTTQYKTDKVYRAEIEKMVTIIEDDAFKAGRQFAKDYPGNIRNDAFMAGQQFVKDYPSSMTNIDSSNSTGPTANCDNTYEKSAASTGTNNNKGKEKATSSTFERTLGLEKYKTDLTDATANPSTSLDGGGSSAQQQETSGNVGGLFSQRGKNKTTNEQTQPLGATDRRDLLQLINEKLRMNSSKKERTTMNWREHEALHFMRGIMDECTHLKNFSCPVDTGLITAVCARDDGYVPREGVTNLADIWPGAEVRYLNAGHVSAFILHQKMFRAAIIDSFDRAKVKYYDTRQSRNTA